MTFETWEQVITWEWCRKCAISWHLGDKPLCSCESLEEEEEQVDCFECGATWKHDCQC